MRLFTVIAISIFAVPLPFPAQSQTGDALERILSPTEERLDTYVAERTLEAGNARLGRHGRLEATTELASGRLTYRVTSRTGSDLVVRRVLEAALEKERDAVAANRVRGALSRDNYAFYVESPTFVRIRPLRPDPFLVDGGLTLSAAGDLESISGVLAKSPSFWTSHVRVERTYGRIDGVRAPVRMTSTARVRFAGVSTFSMTYRYLSINGRPVGRHPAPTK